LSKSDRKRSQVTRSFSKSHEAKLVKLADQLHNLTDLINEPLWTPVIMQGYFVWKWHVMQGLRGTNEYLEAAIDNLFNSTFEMDDTTWPTLPSTDPTVLAQLLEEYYNSV
jgi:guanosine-3',5'-bis(diphosphate) 3'-pyrophosphohydrolase